MDGILLCVAGIFAIIYVMRHDRKENEEKFNENMDLCQDLAQIKMSELPA